MQQKIKIYFWLLFCLASLKLFAQNDTSGRVVITSAYKPVLKNAVKIPFVPTAPQADTARKAQAYNIPARSLSLAYEPLAMKPIEIERDSSILLGNRRYAKLGFGNYSTPYIEAGLGLGDGRQSLLNIKGVYTSSKGSQLREQDFSLFNVEGAGSYFLPENEIYGLLGVSSSKHFLYGYDQILYNPKKDEIKQAFQDFYAKTGFRNTTKNAMGINYNPNLALSLFSYMDKLSETTLQLNFPASYSYNDKWDFKAALKVDATKLSTKYLPSNNYTFNNNLVSINPSIFYKGNGFKLNAGLVPTWSLHEFKLLPDLFVEVHPEEKNYSIIGGLKGSVVKNTYKSLSSTNPWTLPINFQKNTTETEFYGGIRTTLEKKFQLNAKAGFVRYENLPLYANDTNNLAQNGFHIVYADNATNFRISSELSYTMPEKIAATASLVINGFAGIKNQQKPWHLLPMELRGAIQYTPNNRVSLKSDLLFFGKYNYLKPNNGFGTSKSAMDLSIAAEYRINNKFSFWANLNNLTGSKYERWFQYPVYGTNFLAGVIVRF